MMNRRYIILILSLLAALYGGCFEDLEEIPVYSDAEDLEAPEIVMLQSADSEITINWNSIAGASGYRVYRRTIQSEERLVTETPDTLFTDTGLLNGQEYYYSVAGITGGGIEGGRSDWVRAVPSAYSITINQGSQYTSSRNTSLSLTAPSSTVLMKISNSPDLTGEDWETFSSSRTWILENGDGMKTVYAIFMDESGSESGVISETIYLDTYASVMGINITPETGINIGDIIHFRMDVEGNETGGEGYLFIEGYPESIRLYDNGEAGDSQDSDGRYETDFRSPRSLRGVDLAVTGQFTDRAGNISPVYESEGTITFTDPPEPVQLLGISDSTINRITIEWVSYQEDDFYSYIVYRDTVSHSVQEFEDPRYKIQELFNQQQDSYPDSGLDEAVRYYYRVYIVNDLSETAGSNEISASTYDALPDPVILDELSSVGTDQVTLTWSINQNTDFSEYRIYRDTSPGVTNEPSLLVATIGNREITWYDDSGINLTSNDYYYRIYIYDTGGNFSRSNEVTSEP
ncbi:MAG: hypothetical protein GF417_00660 [Candidatus Latescibacteria bacterium]|nr:hypothetical protein [bacterium]MBD3422937.1 hypothetical protein [Candidatus Latescibacterota bacterium]